METGLDTTEGDKGDVGERDIGEGGANSADTKSNVQTLAHKDKLQLVKWLIQNKGLPSL